MPDDMRKELKALLLSLFLLAVGVLLLWAANSWIKKDPTGALGDVVLLSLLIMPILIYAITSGSLAELKGPGGLGATFNSVASASVSDAIAHDPVTIDEDHQIFAKGSTHTLKTKIQSLEEDKPIVMTVTIGEGRYTRDALCKYVEALTPLRNFKLVVFLNRDKRFLACMSPWSARQILHSSTLSDGFVEVINGGRHELLYYPGVVRNIVSSRSTNADALRTMVNHNLDAIAVTDQTNRLKGIAEREQVVAKMMLALLKR